MIMTFVVLIVFTHKTLSNSAFNHASSPFYKDDVHFVRNSVLLWSFYDFKMTNDTL